MKRAILEAAIIVTFVFGICALAIGAAALGSRSGKPAHECVAPCTVVLGDVEEDEFGIDYGWRDRRTAVLDVYGPNERDAARERGRRLTSTPRR